MCDDGEIAIPWLRIDDQTLSQITSVYKFWRNTSFPDVETTRTDLNKFMTSKLGDGFMIAGQSLAGYLLNNNWSLHGDDYRKSYSIGSAKYLGLEMTKSCVTSPLMFAYSSGINGLFHYGTTVLDGYLSMVMVEKDPWASVVKQCSAWIDGALSCMTSHPDMRVDLICADALDCERMVGRNVLDCVHVSNILDHLSAMSMLVAAYPCMTVTPHSMLFGETMLWMQVAPTVQEYIAQCCFGLHISCLPAVLGWKFVDEESASGMNDYTTMRSESVASVMVRERRSRNNMTLRFSLVPPTVSPTSTQLITYFESCMKLLKEAHESKCGARQPMLYAEGVYLRSMSTCMHMLRNIIQRYGPVDLDAFRAVVPREYIGEYDAFISYYRVPSLTPIEYKPLKKLTGIFDADNISMSAIVVSLGAMQYVIGVTVGDDQYTNVSIDKNVVYSSKVSYDVITCKSTLDIQTFVMLVIVTIRKRRKCVYCHASSIQPNVQ